MLILERKICHQTLRLLRLERTILTTWSPTEEREWERETILPTAPTTSPAGARAKAHLSERQDLKSLSNRKSFMPPFPAHGIVPKLNYHCSKEKHKPKKPNSKL